VVLEARGEDHRVTWALGTDLHYLGRIGELLQTHLPGIQFVADDARELPDLAVRAGYRGSPTRQLGAAHPEPISRTMLGALARAGRREHVVLQVVLGQRRRPSELLMRQRPDRAQALKWRDPRFLCDIRIAATATTEERVGSLVGSVVTGARVLDAPGVKLHASRASVDGFLRVRLPWIWRSELSPQELIPLTAWPVGSLPLPGVADPHPKLLLASQEHPKSGLIVGLATGSSTPRPVAIRPEDALRHLHLLGPTGVGKSTLVAHLALQDIETGRGLVLIDPKGDLVEALLGRIPEDRQGDVVVLDPRDDSPVGLAGLQGDPDRVADALLAVFHSLYADSWGPRSHDIIHAGLLTLARRGDTSLVLLPTLLTNPGFRRSVTQKIVRDDPLGLGTFWSWYEALSEGERQQAIAPVMNKLRPVLLRPGMRHTLGQPHPRFQLSDVFTERRILLVSLSKGQLGPEAAQLLGSLVVALLWDEITARVSATGRKPTHTGVYIDEVQDYLRLPGDLGDALVQARGYGVALTLAHQHLGQLPRELKDAVLANARSRVMFGLSSKDAVELARTSRGQVEPIDLESLPAYKAYAALLVGGSPAPWVSITTQPMPKRSSNAERIRALSRESYGVPATETDADLRGFLEPPKGPDERIGRTPKRPGGSS
jgi:hypothetical protein